MYIFTSIQVFSLFKYVPFVYRYTNLMYHQLACPIRVRFARLATRDLRVFIYYPTSKRFSWAERVDTNTIPLTISFSTM
jgi:hypothetical protein